jgi:hypothetical protein
MSPGPNSNPKVIELAKKIKINNNPNNKEDANKRYYYSRYF